jgi:hypothetical protein
MQSGDRSKGRRLHIAPRSSGAPAFSTRRWLSWTSRLLVSIRSITRIASTRRGLDSIRTNSFFFWQSRRLACGSLLSVGTTGRLLNLSRLESGTGMRGYGGSWMTETPAQIRIPRTERQGSAEFVRGNMVSNRRRTGLTGVATDARYATHQSVSFDTLSPKLAQRSNSSFVFFKLLPEMSESARCHQPRPRNRLARKPTTAWPKGINSTPNA